MSADSPEGITPALTPEEWGGKAFGRHQYGLGLRAYVEDDTTDGSVILVVNGEWLTPAERHKLAALCLWGTPQGFSYDDYLFLMQVAQDHRPQRPRRAEHLERIAARIAALLPPEP